MTSGEFIDKYEDFFKHDWAWPDCGIGWLPLLDKLCGMIKGQLDNIEKYNEGWFKNEVITPEKYESNKKLLENFKIVQIKEKFGGLRFYVQGTDYKEHKDIHGWITFAESMSYVLCEGCGTNQGLGTTSGWMRTICKPCAIDIDKGDVWMSKEDQKKQMVEYNKNNK
jgi:hypothetical protein